MSAKEALKLDSSYQPAIDLLTDIKKEYYKRGLTALGQNEWKSAEKFAEEVLRIDPNYELASELLRIAYYEQGLDHIKNSKYEEGINMLQKANDINTNCEKTHYYLGLAYFEIDKLKEARLAVKQTLSIQPDHPQARELLSKINHPRNWLKLGVANVQQFTRSILNRIRF